MDKQTKAFLDAKMMRMDDTLCNPEHICLAGPCCTLVPGEEEADDAWQAQLGGLGGRYIELMCAARGHFLAGFQLEVRTPGSQKESFLGKSS